MLFLVLAREEGVPDVEFVQDAAEGPHVDSGVIRDPENNFWCTVESRLDVGVNFLIFETATSKVDDFNAGLINLPQQDVLRFQVTVHNIVLAHVVQGNEYLDSESLDQRQREAFEIVHLDEIVEVDTEQFERDDQMLAEDELIIPSDDILLVFRILFIKRFNKFGFYQALLIQPLFVLKNFQSHVLF